MTKTKPPPKSLRDFVALTAAENSDSTPHAVTITHLEKILYPTDGITKADVVAYYRKVAPRLLPFLKDRPMTLERLPDGLGEGKPHFWQKNTPASYPKWIPLGLRLAGSQSSRHTRVCLLLCTTEGRD